MGKPLPYLICSPGGGDDDDGGGGGGGATRWRLFTGSVCTSAHLILQVRLSDKYKGFTQ